MLKIVLKWNCGSISHNQVFSSVLWTSQLLQRRNTIPPISPRILRVQEILTTPSRCTKPYLAPSINSLHLPPGPQHPCRHKCPQTRCIATPGEDNQAPELPSTRSHQLACNWDPRQASKRNKRVAGRIVPPIVLNLAKLPHTDGCQRDA